MRKRLLSAMRGRGGVIRRDEALQIVPIHVVDDAVRVRAILVAFPGVYVLPDIANEAWQRRASALAYQPNAAISHTDALDLWDLPTPCLERVHVTVDSRRSAVHHPQVVVHRRQGFDIGAPSTVRRAGLTVVRLEQAAIESWALLGSRDQRAPTITAVRRRLTTPARLERALHRQPTAPGAKPMQHLFGLLAAGNQSELEIWGHGAVFSDPRLPTSRTQHHVEVGGQTFYLDRYFEAEMLAVELDGAEYHGGPSQREADVGRDALVATTGIQTIRYTHRRLHDHPGGVVDELVLILDQRRRMLRLAG